MYDCPNCRVPLHGYEDSCPSCGTAQYVKKGFRNLSHVQQAPGVNWMPFVAVFVIVGIGIFVAAQSTWIGQVMKQGPRQEDPMEKLTFMDARNIIEQKVTEGLTAVGAKAKFNWQNADGSPSDKNSPQDVQLSIETKLKDPNSRKSIIDPIKAYMEKAKIPTLTMTDARSHATWTYTVQPSAAASQPPEEMPNFDGGSHQESPAPSYGGDQQQPQQAAQPQQTYQQPVEQQQVQQSPQQQQPVEQQQAPAQQEANPWDADAKRYGVN